MKQFKLFVVSVLFGIVGCGGGNPMVGTWKMEMADSMKSQMPEGMKMPEMSVEFKGDGTFAATADIMGKKSTAKGTYKLEGSSLTMTTTEEDGKAKSQTETVTLSEDKKSFDIPNSNGMGKMVKQ